MDHPTSTYLLSNENDASYRPEHALTLILWEEWSRLKLHKQDILILESIHLCSLYGGALEKNLSLTTLLQSASFLEKAPTSLKSSAAEQKIFLDVERTLLKKLEENSSMIKDSPQLLIIKALLSIKQGHYYTACKELSEQSILHPNWEEEIDIITEDIFPLYAIYRMIFPIWPYKAITLITAILVWKGSLKYKEIQENRKKTKQALEKSKQNTKIAPI